MTDQDMGWQRAHGDPEDRLWIDQCEADPGLQRTVAVATLAASGALQQDLRIEDDRLRSECPRMAPTPECAVGPTPVEPIVAPVFPAVLLKPVLKPCRAPATCGSSSSHGGDGLETVIERFGDPVRRERVRPWLRRRWQASLRRRLARASGYGREPPRSVAERSGRSGEASDPIPRGGATGRQPPPARRTRSPSVKATTRVPPPARATA